MQRIQTLSICTNKCSWNLIPFDSLKLLPVKKQNFVKKRSSCLLLDLDLLENIAIWFYPQERRWRNVGFVSCISTHKVLIIYVKGVTDQVRLTETLQRNFKVFMVLVLLLYHSKAPLTLWKKTKSSCQLSLCTLDSWRNYMKDPDDYKQKLEMPVVFTSWIGQSF